MKIIQVSIASLALIGLGTTTFAAVTVLGGGEAQACYDAARSGRSDDGAITTCDRALDNQILDPRDRGGTLINRGVLKLRRGLYDSAHGDFDAGIALAPNVGEGFINRGAMFVGQRNYKDGLDDIQKGLALGVKEPEKAYFNRAIAHEGQGDEKAAYLDYQQAAALKPGWPAPEHELKRFTVTERVATPS